MVTTNMLLVYLTLLRSAIVEYQIIQNPNNPLYGKTYEEVKAVLHLKGAVLQYVYNQTEELCKLAIRQDSFAVRYVSDEFIEIFTK